MENDQHFIDENLPFPSTIPNSNQPRLTIRRNLLRETTSIRSAPYDRSMASTNRRRQTFSQIVHENHRQSNVAENEQLFDESNSTNNEILQTSQDSSNEFLPVEDQLHESYHSLSTVDFDPEQFDEETNEQNFDYPSSSSSSSIPLIDYSSIPSESVLILNNNSTGPLENDRNDEFHSNTTINENVPVDEDLTIEIVLETSNNDNLHNPSVYSPSLSNSSTSPISRRRRRSILPSNIIQSRGLRLSDILSIPQKLYSSLKEQTIDKYRATTSMINTECYICLEDFQSLDSIKLLQCQHVFHSECINEWLRNHDRCAYCRTPVRVELLQTSSSLINSRPPSDTRRRQRARARRNQYVLSRSANSNSFQSISFSPTPFDGQNEHQT